MFAAFTILSLIATPAQPPKEKELPEAAQKELKKFLGKWKATTVLMDGQERAPNGEGKDVFLQFNGRKVILFETEKGMDLFDIDALDPTTMPKILDLRALADQVPVTKGTVYEAIYQLEGDALTLAIYIGQDKKRPEKFESAKDSAIVVVKMKREKN